ncbi:MAG: carboxymuconolactone decarboxylase family protein [Burkholderiaceae bacterium]|jgi:4-carboxymuconolactone decarboxylase
MIFNRLTLFSALLGFAICPPSAHGQTAEKPKRFPQITLEQLDPQAQVLGQEIMKISSVGLGGPYNPMLRSPVMAERLKRLLDYLRFETSLPTRLNEFAILIQGRLWTSQVEWYAHYPLALKAGLPASVADALKANVRPQGMRPDEEVVYDVCMQMSDQHEISDDLFNRAKSILGEKQLVDLIAVSGTYVTVAMLLSLAEEGVPAGKPLPFPEAAK